ncbi:MAG: hypothetical protein ABSG61_14285 [Gemmatimonadales bacterium]|jgi:predicted DNA-binding transcriptional regulator AlpA
MSAEAPLLNHIAAMIAPLPADAPVVLPKAWVERLLSEGRRTEQVKIERQIDQLLKVKEVASRLRMSVSWVYRHARILPFVRYDSLRPRALRFSERGLQKYIDELEP